MNIFSKIKSCWGSNLVSPVASAASNRRPMEEDHGDNSHVRPLILSTNNKRPVNRVSKYNKNNKRINANYHWRPKLLGINEDRPMIDVAVKINGNNRRSNDKTSPVKFKLKSVSSPPSSSKDYWKFADTSSDMPTIAPMSFVF